MADPDFTRNYSPRPGLRWIAVLVLLNIIVAIALVAVSCAPKEGHAHLAVPSRSARHALQVARAGERESARASRSRPPATRAHDGVPPAQPRVRDPGLASGGFDLWRRSQAALDIVQCESLNDHSYDHHYGPYRGFWQIGRNEWRDWGGLRFAASPELASRVQQDLVAYTGYRARGWEPWDCARILGYWP